MSHRLNPLNDIVFKKLFGEEETSHAYCEDCYYETDSMPMKELLYKLCMEGGYIVSDKNGGYFSQCPKCGGKNLTLGTD